MTIYGYARVSTDGQTLDAQIEALKTAGAGKVYNEKQSGAKTDRAALARVLLNVLATIAERGAGFRSLADPWADTTTPHGRLMLTVLGGLAEFERSLILARTSEGRTRAMARGIKFGRKPKLTQHQIAEAIRRRDAGEAMTEIGRTYNVSHSTISRL
jgi:DNA invertase Pin-like site-specific DNA recombinase